MDQRGTLAITFDTAKQFCGAIGVIEQLLVQQGFFEDAQAQVRYMQALANADALADRLIVELSALRLRIQAAREDRSARAAADQAAARADP